MQKQQGSLLGAKQGTTGLDANIKQLEKLADRIKQAGEKYEVGYKKLVKLADDADCYLTAKQYVVESAVSQCVRSEIDGLMTDADVWVCQAQKSIADLETEYAEKQAAYIAATKYLGEIEKKLDGWIGVEKWLLDLLKQLDGLAKKIDVAEDECDFCRMYVHVQDYQRLLCNPRDDSAQADDDGDCAPLSICEVLLEPGDLLSITPTWQFFLRSSGAGSSNKSAARQGTAAVSSPVRREPSFVDSPQQRRGPDRSGLAPHRAVEWPTPMMRIFERVRPVSHRAASTTAPGISQQLPLARISTGATATDRPHSSDVAAAGVTAAHADHGRWIVPTFRRVEYAAPRQSTTVATPGRAAPAVHSEPAAPRVESPSGGVAPHGQRIPADMLLSPATVGLLTEQVMRQLDRRVISVRERLGNT